MAGKRIAQDDFTIVGQFAQWAELTGDELEAFVKEIMTRRGHKPVTGWRENDGDNSGSKDDKSSNVLGINFGGPKQQQSGGNWQYGS